MTFAKFPVVYVKSIDGVRWYVGANPLRMDLAHGDQMQGYIFSADPRDDVRDAKDRAIGYAKAVGHKVIVQRAPYIDPIGGADWIAPQQQEVA